jgi:hypothetical protein
MTRTTLADLTVGDLRALVHYGGSEADTLADALERIAEGNRISHEHEANVREYDAYRTHRQERYGAELASAAAAADEQARGQGDGARMAARQSARAEAAETFEQREPLLEFAEWQDAGRPEVHEIGAVRSAVARVKAAIA